MIHIRPITPSDVPTHIRSLAALLLDSVSSNASVGFMPALSPADAAAFFTHALSETSAGNRTLLAAFLDSRLVGTVQLIPATAPNQSHRADVAKLLVHSSARGQGVATRLMQHLEQTARAQNRTLLVLDTCIGTAAEKLYHRLGWTKAGIIPNYALFPDGSPCDTAIFFKRIS